MVSWQTPGLLQGCLAFSRGELTSLCGGASRGVALASPSKGGVACSSLSDSAPRSMALPCPQRPINATGNRSDRAPVLRVERHVIDADILPIYIGMLLKEAMPIQ